MPKDKNKGRISKKTLNDIGIADTIVSKMIMSLDDNYVSTLNLNEKNAAFKNIINDELELTRGMSKGNIIDFTRSISETNNTAKTKTIGEDDDLYKYITQNSGSIYQTFNERYKNKFIEAQDLKFISKFVPSIGQAVRLALDHITSSDDLSGSFTRNLVFGTNMDEDDTAVLTKAIEKFENDNRLLFKLKNSCFYNCLITGKYYIYATSYAKLFSEYSKSKALTEKYDTLQGKSVANGDVPMNIASEGVNYFGVDREYGLLANTYALESTEIEELKPLLKTNNGVGNHNSVSMMGRESFLDNISTITTLESHIPCEVLDCIPGFEALLDDLDNSSGDGYREVIDKATKNQKNPNMIADGTVDSKKAKGEKFDTTGTFIKFIDATKVIPIKVLDEIVGYFYVETRTKKKDQDAAKFIAGEFSNIRREDAIEKIAKMLSQKVVDNFSAKFVANNIQFKNLIANCILANGVINQEYKIQFISTDDMIPFSVNPDENGDGQSMLSDALFPAKLLTSYTMKKNLNYVNKSGDKTIAYVRSGITDSNNRNQVMRIIRNLQEQNVTFGDMMSDYSMMFHKYASDNNIVMPTGRSGNKLVDFEKMDGQQIDMGTEYEKNLENQCLVATGVPPLLIEQYNQADFSKAYTTAHIGFAGRVASWQSDLEEGSTLLYKKIIENLDIDDDIKSRALPLFSFKLPRPKSLSAINNTESLNNAVQIGDTVANLEFGEDNGQDNDDVTRDIKLEVKRRIVRDLTPFIDWDHYQDIITEARLAIDNVKASTGGDNDMASPSEF